jgi:heterotetrameric sarcosine oxidase gamma subunit
MTEARKPIKRSPLHHSLTRAGAALTQISGWLVAEHFGDALREAQAVRSGAGLCDRSSAPKFEIQGKETAATLHAVLGAPSPEAGRAAAAAWGCACRLGPEQALLVLDAESASPAWLSQSKLQARCAHMVDRTHGYASLLLCGPAASDILRKLTSLDVRDEKLPNLSCAAGPMASIRVVLLRRDRARLPGYEVFCNREYGEYLWSAVMEAGAEFKMKPFGRAAEGHLV